jgi:hypothetical protein
MWNMQEWVFFKKNLIEILKKNNCRLTFNNKTNLICYFSNVVPDTELKKMWVEDVYKKEQVLIDLTTITRIEILD